MRAAALAVCHLLKQKNIEPVMELTARDRNRIAIQSDLLGAGMVGIENVLLVSGYPPAVGDHAQAEDLTQEVFLRVFRTAKRYKPMAKFSTWLYGIAAHVALAGAIGACTALVTVALAAELRVDGSSRELKPGAHRVRV